MQGAWLAGCKSNWQKLQGCIRLRSPASKHWGRSLPELRSLRRACDIRAVLERVGVVFTDGEEPGVKLRNAEP